jgi:hypothetical protein
MVVFAFGCGGGGGSKPDKPVARAGKYYLDEVTLRGILPKNISAADSAVLAKNYIERWMKDNLLVEKAEDDGVDDVNIDKMVEDYRKSLLMAAYQKKYIKQSLDTIVSDKDVEQYYKANQQNFRLQSNIVRVRYVKLGKKAPNIPKVKTWCQSDKPTDRKALESYCLDHAENYYLDDNSWLLYDDLLKEIPLKNYGDAGLNAPRFVELEDSAFVYFVNIKAFQTKETASPVGFVKESIKDIILNKRKTKLLLEMENKLYKEAVGNSDVEIYSNKQ